MLEFDPAVITQVITVALLIAKDLSLGFLKRKVGRKDVELGMLYDKFSNLELQVSTMSSAQKAVLQGEDLILRAINNLTQAAKIPQPAKDYGMDLISNLSLIIKDVAYENVDQLIEVAKEQLRAEALKKQIPTETADAVINAATEAISKIPDTVKKYLSDQG